MKRKKRIISIFTLIAALAVCICAAFIAIKGIGIVEEYDFGAGAYYYADIPGFETLLNEDAYDTQVPVWVHIILFLGWGWLMYRLWCWIDSRSL